MVRGSASQRATRGNRGWPERSGAGASSSSSSREDSTIRHILRGSGITSGKHIHAGSRNYHAMSSANFWLRESLRQLRPALFGSSSGPATQCFSHSRRWRFATPFVPLKVAKISLGVCMTICTGGLRLSAKKYSDLNDSDQQPYGKVDSVIRSATHVFQAALATKHLVE